eukprot:TRINITY_DN22909_c0_g1_i1.p1 TRINITY_DN22909_c0_g1~~TRINITY_DN22909_c0_g1_i1.p1  ORF type:complete len:666 (-),score=102.58 TRINITY_DN22909_c0_g1_i1:217-2214(-)
MFPGNVPTQVFQLLNPPVTSELPTRNTYSSSSHSERGWKSGGSAASSRLWASISSTACAAVLARQLRGKTSLSRQHPAALNHSARRAVAWGFLESSKEDIKDAMADLSAQAAASMAGNDPLSFALLSIPPKWANDMATACEFLRFDCSSLQNIPLIGMQSGDATSVQLGLARGGTAQSFFVNKENLSLAGGGLAKSASADVPGVPAGDHASFLLFSDPLVPAALTRNLLDALDGRYPNSLKAGLVVMPAKASDSSANDDDAWEPPKDGSRQLRPRNRDDGHGWLSGDPSFRSEDEESQTDGVTAEFKRRPFGVKRYCPGVGGTGAMVLDMFEKSRYPGDALGQSAVAGVAVGMVVKSINGQDVRSWDFEDIMDVLNDEGVVDPDNKSAAQWGSAKELCKRQPKEPAELPLAVEFVQWRSAASSGSAPLCLNGQARRDGVVGLALPDGGASALDLEGCTRVGPELKVKASGKIPSGGFAINTVELNGKELPAAGALKMAAKAAGLSNMKGMNVGLPRPQSYKAAGVTDNSAMASDWALFPILNVTQEGGLVLRCKGLVEEGLGGDEHSLERIQIFCPKEGSATFQELSSNLQGKTGYATLAFATRQEALKHAPKDALGIVGAAVIGTGGVKSSEGRSAMDSTSSNVFTSATTKLHRQAAVLAVLTK